MSLSLFIYILFPDDFHLVSDNYRKAGRLDVAGAVYQAALSYWRQAVSLHQQTDLLNNIGVMQRYAGRYELACQALNEGLQLARQCGYTRLEAFILTTLGDVYADLARTRDDLLQAHNLLESAM